MKQSEVAKMLLGGAMSIVAEFRSGKAEVISWRGDGGEALSAPVVRCTLEAGDTPITVNARPTEDLKTKEQMEAWKSGWKCPFEKGKKVLFHFTEITTNKGLVSGRGVLESIDKE